MYPRRVKIALRKEWMQPEHAGSDRKGWARGGGKARIYNTNSTNRGLQCR